MSYLEKINSPADVKALSIDSLQVLADEMRELILQRVLENGGHFGPNLGFVEATVALHYVFDSPKDKFVFDVSHQVYPHKMLTGRKEKFTIDGNYYAYSGYTNPNESEHDFFTVGHTSTSISLATGLAKARDLKGESGNIIAIIGDGSMSGGEAFEGLNNAAELNSNMIVLFNDNDMSIAENHGGMYRNFKELRDTKGKAPNNFFKAMGMDYIFVEDGHNIPLLIEAFKSVKDSTKPVVVHVVTQKGKGYKPAELDKETNHYILGKDFDADAYMKEEHYDQIVGDILLKRIKEDKSVIAICPAVPGGVGASKEFRKEAGSQYVDVGIAEEHAIAFASGLAKNGAKPVVLDYGTFLQRTYDQLLQDLSLNRNAATILSFTMGGGITGFDATHTSLYDMAMMSNIPGLLCLSPATKDEFIDMLDWSINQEETPVVIRVPNKVYDYKAGSKFTSANKEAFQVVKEGKDVAIIGLGEFFDRAKTIYERLAKEGIEATLINPRVYSDVDENVLENLKANHSLVVSLEDGIMSGGLGEKIAHFYSDSSMKVMVRGAYKEFTDRVPVNDLYAKYRLHVEDLVEDIKENLK